MSNKLKLIIEYIQNGAILSSIMFDSLDFEIALNERDCQDFEKYWMKSFNAIQKVEKNRPISDEDSDLINFIRELAYKQTYFITEYPDLCGYVSDDFEIIAKALSLKLDDPWINALWSSYKSGVFPSKKLSNVTGPLWNLI